MEYMDYTGQWLRCLGLTKRDCSSGLKARG